MTKEYIEIVLASLTNIEMRDRMRELIILVYNDAIETIADSADIYTPDGDIIFTSKGHILKHKII